MAKPLTTILEVQAGKNKLSEESLMESFANSPVLV